MKSKYQKMQRILAHLEDWCAVNFMIKSILWEKRRDRKNNPGGVYSLVPECKSHKAGGVSDDFSR